MSLQKQKIDECASSEAVRNYLMVYYGLASDIERLQIAKKDCRDDEIRKMIARQIESIKFIRRTLKRYIK